MDLWNLQKTFGSKNELVCCSSVNTGLYTAFKQMGNVQGVFCGHDHANDYHGDYHGVRLHYGRKTGFGGHADRKDQKRILKKGARIIEVSYDQNENSFVDFKSWIRESDGGVDMQDQPTPNSEKTDQVQAYCDRRNAASFFADEL